MSTLNQQANANAIPNHDIFYTKFKLNGVVCNVEDLTITVRDNLSTLNFFEISATGIKL